MARACSLCVYDNVNSFVLLETSSSFRWRFLGMYKVQELRQNATRGTCWKRIRRQYGLIPASTVAPAKYNHKI